jgi:hypothetical protein
MPRKTAATPATAPAERASRKPAPPAITPYAERPGIKYRCRPIDPKASATVYTDDLEEAKGVLSDLAFDSIPAVVEIKMGPAYGILAAAAPVTVEELAAAGQARQTPDKRWAISPEGQRRIYESMGLS